MIDQEPRAAPANVPAAAPGEPARDAGVVRVMSYNIHGGRDPEGRLDLPAIAAVIRGEDPDLVALQEVHQRLPQSHCQPQPALLERAARLVARFVPSVGFSLCGYGNAVLSRHGVESWRRHLLPSAGEQRSVIEARLTLGGEPVRVLATHLGLQVAERQKQLLSLASLAARGRGIPVLVMGDLNEQPDSDNLAPLTDLGFRHALPPEVATFPSTAPAAHIDYVLVDDTWEVLSARAPASLASDHLPVVVDLVRR